MVKRELYLERVSPFYDSEMIKVITGIRRCGKSTLMQQTIEDNYPKYVISTDRIPMSRDGIIHMNLCQWLLS